MPPASHQARCAPATRASVAYCLTSDRATVKCTPTSLWPSWGTVPICRVCERPSFQLLNSKPRLTANNGNCYSFWQRTFPSLDPRLSSRWIASITLATRLICAETSASPQHSSNFQNLMDTCFPACFSHAWASKGLAHDNPLIAYLVALFLMSCLQKTAATVQSLSSQNTARSSALAKRIRSDVSERLPDPKNVINLLQKGASEAPANSDEHGIALLTYLRLIKLYYQFAPSTTTAMRYDFTKLVDPLLSDPSATEPNALLAASQIAFFELTTLPGVDINWLKGTSDNAPIYKLCSVILASTVPAVRDSGTKALIHCLGRSNLFEQEQSLEMAVWICALRGSTTGHRKAVTFLFGSSLQKASSSTFKCIEEVERLLPKHGSSSVSPLLAGWKQQCGYLSEHRPEDLRAAQSASTRVAQGYLGSHDHRTCQNVQHALKVDSVQEIVGEESTDQYVRSPSTLARLAKLMRTTAMMRWKAPFMIQARPSMILLCPRSTLPPSRLALNSASS